MGSGLMKRSLKHGAVALPFLFAAVGWGLVPRLLSSDCHAVFGARLYVCKGVPSVLGGGVHPVTLGRGPFPRTWGLLVETVTPRAEAASVSGAVAGQGGGVPVSQIALQDLSPALL